MHNRETSATAKISPTFLFIFSSPKTAVPFLLRDCCFFIPRKEKIVFEYSDSNKRYHTLNYYNKALGMKIYKAALNCGFSCPNIDGTCGKRGCIYCSEGSRLFTNDKNLSVTRQLELERDRILSKNPDAVLCAYFQSNTNTYAPAGKLRELYYEAADFPLVKTMAIATRPDCLPEDVLELLKEINSVKPLTVELGLQTANDVTAKKINRGYEYAVFETAFRRLKEAGIRVCVHLIDGLPGESREDMLSTAEIIGRLKPDALKIHLLYVAEGTQLADMFERGEYTPLTLEEYTDIAVSQIEYFPPETVIERITGDGDKRTLLAPMWSADKIRVLGTIDALMAQRDIYQGDKTNS